MADRTYTVTEIAQAVGCGKTTVRRLAERLGLQPVVVHQGVQYYTAADLERIAAEYKPRFAPPGPERVVTFDDDGERCTAEDAPRAAQAQAPAEIVAVLRADMDLRAQEMAQLREITAVLQQDLADRRTAEAQLREDIAADRERHAAEVAALRADLEAERARHAADLATMRAQLQQARKAPADRPRGLLERLLGKK